MKLHWSDVAEADLDDIYRLHRQTTSPAMCLNYAELFVDRLIEATDKLQDHPKIGRRVLEAEDRDDVRELIVQGYRIIYLMGCPGFRVKSSIVLTLRISL